MCAHWVATRANSVLQVLVEGSCKTIVKYVLDFVKNWVKSCSLKCMASHFSQRTYQIWKTIQFRFSFTVLCVRIFSKDVFKLFAKLQIIQHCLKNFTIVFQWFLNWLRRDFLTTWKIIEIKKYNHKACNLILYKIHDAIYNCFTTSN